MGSRGQAGLGPVAALAAVVAAGIAVAEAQTTASGVARAERGAAPVTTQDAPSSAWPTAPAHGPKLGGHRFVKRGAGKMYPRDGLMTELKLSAADTAGRLTYIDEVWYPRFSVRPHFHLEHSETFYVLSGQVEWTIAGETHVLGAGDLVYIPPDTPHATRVIGDQDMRTLMIYEPGGHEIHLEDEQRYTAEERKRPEVFELLRAHYDFNPTEMWKPAEAPPLPAPPARPTPGSGPRAVRPVYEAPHPVKHRFVTKAQGEAFHMDDEVSVVKLSSADTDGRYSLMDEVWKRGMAVPPHYHAAHNEVFFVMAGRTEWTVGGETQVVGPGDLVYVPAGTVHTVKVIGDEDVHMLFLYNPGGYEYVSRREFQYTPVERKLPAVQEMLRRESDFNPVGR